MYVVHVLVMHVRVHYAIDTIKIISVDRLTILIVAHQQLKPEGNAL